MYVRGYLQGSENGRVITIDGEHFKKINDSSLSTVYCELRLTYNFNLIFKWIIIDSPQYIN